MQGVPGGVGIVVLGYLGQLGSMEAVVAGVQQAPGLKFRIGMLALQAGNGHGVLPSLWIQSAAVLVAVATKQPELHSSSAIAMSVEIR